MSLFPDDPDTPHSGSSFADHLASILAEEDDAGALDFLPPEDLAQINEANADGIPDMFERVTDARSVNKKSRDSRGILKIELLEGVSAELADHSKYGIPTVLHVSSLIYIGTSHGVVLVFNKKQRLGQVIGSPDNEFGAVSAVDADTTIASDRQVSDNAWIAVGHRSGRVLLWDRKANRVLKTISDAHFSPVMFAKFLPDRSLVTSDLKGSVLIHTFNRIFKIMVLETQCLVNGLVGSVLALSPCPSGRPTASHVTEKYSIVVMATMTKVLLAMNISSSSRPSSVLALTVSSVSQCVVPLLVAKRAWSYRPSSSSSSWHPLAARSRLGRPRAQACMVILTFLLLLLLAPSCALDLAVLVLKRAWSS